MIINKSDKAIVPVPNPMQNLSYGIFFSFNKVFIVIRPIIAVKTKEKELELTYLVLNKKESFEDVEILLHEIAQLRIENTKYQIDLTNKIQEILDDKQYEKLLEIAKRWAR